MQNKQKNPEAAGNSLQFLSVNLKLLRKFTNCCGVKWVDLVQKLTGLVKKKSKQVSKLFFPNFTLISLAQVIS